jgi:hypothetical protein
MDDTRTAGGRVSVMSTAGVGITGRVWTLPDLPT